MSSVLEAMLFIWFMVMSLLSSWDDMDVRVELLADDASETEYDKTSFLSVEVDSFDQLYF